MFWPSYSIKSKYNSQYLSTYANDYSSYGVLVNDKCLTVNGLCKDDFCLLDCQKYLYTSDSQKFSTKRIYNANDASRIMNVPLNKINTNNVYPYNIFTSAVNNLDTKYSGINSCWSGKSSPPRPCSKLLPTPNENSFHLNAWSV